MAENIAINTLVVADIAINIWMAEDIPMQYIAHHHTLDQSIINRLQSGIPVQ
jgi:hypothetical protein